MGVAGKPLQDISEKTAHEPRKIRKQYIERKQLKLIRVGLKLIRVGLYLISCLLISNCVVRFRGHIEPSWEL